MILSLVHTPLPQLDFHNIRHHDGPGEVCEHHDHLLRWHPGASAAQDVATLHWHWFLPLSERSDTAPSGDGPALHAHVSDWLAPTWDEGPRILPDSVSRLVRPDTSTPAALPPTGPAEGMMAVLAAGPHRALAFSATFAPGAPLTSLLHRWVC